MNGKFGTAALAAETVTAVTAAVPAAKVRTVNINIVNRGPDATAVRLAVASAAPGDSDWLEYGAALSSGSVLERSSVVMSENEIVYAWADKATVTVSVRGLEKDDV